MCGLVGAMGVTRDNPAIFHNLLMIDVIRGKDSTGVLSVKSDASWAVRKCVGHPLNMITGKKYQERIGATPSFLYMGHNRAATKGVVNLENAHPFVQGNIILAHNGTLWSHRDLVGYNHKVPHFGTDSEHIAYAVNESGIDHVWKELSGAAALTWWDLSDNRFRLITNGQRPLYFVYELTDKSVYWASEDWMLTAALAREKVKHLDIVECVPHKLYEFEWNVEKKVVQHTERMLERRSFLVQKTTGLAGWIGETTRSNHSSVVAADKQHKKNAFHLDQRTGEIFILTDGRKVVVPNVPLAWLSTNDQRIVRERFLADSAEDEDEEVPYDVAEAQDLLAKHPQCDWCNDAFDLTTILDSLIKPGQGAICLSCANHPDNNDLRMMML